MFSILVVVLKDEHPQEFQGGTRCRRHLVPSHRGAKPAAGGIFCRCPITLNGNDIFLSCPITLIYDLSCDENGMVNYFTCDGMGWFIIFRVMGWGGASFSCDGAGRWDGRAFASS